MIPMVRLAVIAAAFFTVSTAAGATTFVCKPDAIQAKGNFVTKTFVDFSAGKYANKGTFGPVIAKIWDGNGDCDTNGNDVSKLPQISQIQLMAMHYYGDVMSSIALYQDKQYKPARVHMDDFLALHDVIVGPMKDGFPASFMAQDKDILPQMKTINAQLTKAGFKPAP